MPSQALLAIKAWQLKQCAFLMGLASSGSKTELASSIQDQLNRSTPQLEGRRVVSVDMGIRNLAFCLLEVGHSNKSLQGTPSTPTNVHVKVWRKIDLLQQCLSHTEDRHVVTEDPDTKVQPKSDAAIASDAFTPCNLAKIAYSVTDHLLSYKPDIILIERQRFRSGGASAIQEWTVRVNMLESMLWACLHTLTQKEATNQRNFSVHDVLPKRVANFWAAPPEVKLRPTPDLLAANTDAPDAASDVAKLGPRKVEKKDKIRVVRSWLKGSREVHLNVEGDAALTVAQFDATRRAATDSVGKLDDLADCLLQAAAWVRWQENRQTVGELLTESEERGVAELPVKQGAVRPTRQGTRAKRKRNVKDQVEV